MNDFDESNITRAVLERFQGTPDPRLARIMAGIVKHLHACVREIEPSFEEWMAAIQFLTRTGQISVAGRQEFILLSDTLGVSMLIDALNNRMPAGTTATTVLGPFYLPDQPVREQGSDLAEGAAGVPLYVEARFLSVDGSPLRQAIVDVWQSDNEGFYDVQRPEPGGPSLRGRFLSDDEGQVRFWSVMPTAYPIPYDGPVGDMLKASNRSPWRPAHLHFMVNAAGHRQLVTHIFVAGDVHLETDPVFGVKHSLIDEYPLQPSAAAVPDGRVVAGPWRKLAAEFRLGKPGA